MNVRVDHLSDLLDAIESRYEISRPRAIQLIAEFFISHPRMRNPKRIHREFIKFLESAA